MLELASGYCDDSYIDPEIHKLDFTKQFSTGNFEDLEGPIIATSFGNTLFNIPKRKPLLSSIRKLLMSRNEEDLHKSTFVIEGHRDKDIEYYADIKSTEFFMQYAGRRLGIPRENLKYNGAETHYVALDKKNSKVEIYGVVTEDVVVNGDVRFLEGDLIKLGMSGTVRPKQLEHELSRVGFDANFYLIENPNSDTSLISCYHKNKFRDRIIKLLMEE